MKILKIYTDHSKVYHEMHQVIFDYEKDFQLYHRYLSKLKCKKILEIGSGSGNLAKYFIDSKYDYTGLDNSKEMIKLAKEFVPEGKFILGDMRNIKLEEKFEAVVVTGRTFTHMTTNHDVMFALYSIHEILQKEGWLLFDNFNAEEIFTNFREQSTHEAKYEGRNYTRKSTTSLDLDHGWTWKWAAEYEIEENNEKSSFKDEMILRAFTEEELTLFLRVNGFKTKEINKEANAILTIAQKINDEKTNAHKLYFKQKLNHLS